ncbi:MAG: CRISPR-associated endonuclease Cas2 [Dehalococcoidales bacterium]|nr:CRISPR-associated endonuclease Cas2 [Dehalococcoidales bacterium]MDX9804097.1 CRISPR-associated endonuclease Cas2 [Dehalococcoidales bacterium]
MLVLITYDVKTESENGQRRLRRVAKICSNYGQRVQKSVFECLVDPEQWVKLRNKLEREININEDSVRYYYLGKNWKVRVEHIGVQTSYDPEGPLLV